MVSASHHIVRRLGVTSPVACCFRRRLFQIITHSSYLSCLTFQLPHRKKQTWIIANAPQTPLSYARIRRNFPTQKNPSPNEGAPLRYFYLLFFLSPHDCYATRHDYPRRQRPLFFKVLFLRSWNSRGQQDILIQQDQDLAALCGVCMCVVFHQDGQRNGPSSSFSISNKKASTD